MSENNALEWSLGLRNYASGKYLTQEQFNFSLNANGTSLKKKQTLYLQTSSNPGTVYIRTHLGRFLYALADGTFKGDKDAPDSDCEWRIEAQVDGTWALQSRHNLFVHGSADNLRCYQKEITSDAKWVVHLAMHPQVNVLNAMRKRFVHYVPESKELQCNEDIPWGSDALLTFVFFDEHPEGRYGFMNCEGQYLSKTGKLVSSPTPDTQFLLGFHDDQISLRDAEGNYLSCVGANGTLKVNKNKVTKDELFLITDSEPQFTIQDNRGKQVSIRSGIEVKADQPDVTDKERFQLELDGQGLASFKSNNSTFWTVGSDASVSSTAKTKGPNEKFTIKYNGPRVQFVASNGKYVFCKSNGAFSASGNGSEESSVFCLTLDNRPELVLRGQFGFVGVKGASGRVEVNRAKGDVFVLKCNNGTYSIASRDGKYWAVDSDGVAAISSSPVGFYLEFPERSKCLIRLATDSSSSGPLLEGEQNGGFKAVGSGINANTLWEY